MANQPISFTIDLLLKAKKNLAGIPTWQSSTWEKNEYKLVWPLEIEDKLCGLDLVSNAYPTYGNSKDRWRIKLLASKCLWRIDYTYNEKHVNPLNGPDDLKGIIIDKPHYHAWEDNKHLCSFSSLPDQLPIARILPPTIKSFANAFRWFCDEINIDLQNTNLIDLPPREYLI